MIYLEPIRLGNNKRKKALVTGASGFIGYYIFMKLFNELIQLHQDVKMHSERHCPWQKPYFKNGKFPALKLGFKQKYLRLIKFLVDFYFNYSLRLLVIGGEENGY